MAPITQPSHLLNPLATSEQLEISASQLDGVSKDLLDSVRFEAGRLVQAAGILLRLPQELIAQAIVILFRYWTGAEGGSLLEHNAKEVAAACLFLTTKPSSHPISPRQVLTTFEFLSKLPSADFSLQAIDHNPKVTWQFTEGQYVSARDRLYLIESHVLRTLGFQTHVALPHTLCINYLQTMGVVPSEEGSLVAKTAFRYLNGTLLSPQLIYLTHQPSAIATAAIYLAAKETKVKLLEVEWWEVFDVDREELGFLVVALQSLSGFALEENQKWNARKIPLTVEDLQAEIDPRA